MTTVVVDGGTITIANHATSQHLSTSDGRPSGAIFNTIRAMRSWIDKFPDVKQIIYTWDSDSCFRLDIHEGYKASRSERDYETPFWRSYREQRSVIKDALRYLGIAQYKAKGFEADDLGGYLAKHFFNIDPVILVSNDRDWLQLVDKNTSVFRPREKKDKEKMVTLKNYQDLTGASSPEIFLQARSIAGDSGDSIPGIDGIGMTTAIRYIEQGPEAVTANEAELIRKWSTNISGRHLAYALSKINTDIPAADLEVDSRSTVNHIAFRRLCENYEFNSILKKFDEWIEPFLRMNKLPPPLPIHSANEEVA